MSNDKQSKLAAVNAIIDFSDKQDIKSFDGLMLVISQYKEVLELQLKEGGSDDL